MDFSCQRFALAHIKNIHKYIFQDIYVFAGKIREENIIKGETYFCRCEFIVQNLEVLFAKLSNERFLKHLEINVFSQRSAYYMSELNIIHPFREGNGRTIREYIRCLALKCGYNINWSLISKNELLSACIISASKNLLPLTQCIYSAIKKD